jgi:hypothetical protein
MMVQMKRWTVGLVLCFLLVASKASATYVVIENITPTSPPFGGCACLQAYGWLAGINVDLTVDGEAFTVASSEWTKSSNIFVLDISKTRPVAPGASYTSKKIIGLPDAGFHFAAQGPGISVYNCEACLDSCGGYFSGVTSVWTSGMHGMDIVPGLAGSDSFDFQVWGPAGDIYSVVRVTFYPGTPPGRGKSK